MLDTERILDETPELLPARMLNEYVYCPRLFYLEWVQTEFSENADVLEGRFVHRQVDEVKGSLPEELSEEDKIHARSVWLSSLAEGITAISDIVEGEGGKVWPVDYKKGTLPENLEQSWPPDRVQLCAQGLILRDMGYNCTGGIIYYAASKTRVPVAFDEWLIADTRRFIKEAKDLSSAGIMPQPLDDSPKCVRCSLSGICLPDETNLLSGRDEMPDEDGIRRLIPARDDAMPLYIQEQGARLSKKAEVLEVSIKGEKAGTARIFETSQVNIFGNIQITTQALHEMMSRGIPVSYFTTGGWFYGLSTGMMHKNIELRMTQFRLAVDKEFCNKISRAFVSAKIDNCRTLLMRNHFEKPQEIISDLSTLSKEAAVCDAIESLLGIEGLAAKKYYSAFNGMLKNKTGDYKFKFDFNGRNRRPPKDPVNTLLSYAYSLLAKDVTVICLAVGFDPFLGFYHRPRYGRPALALDVMEEFRPIIADSVVLSVINNGVLDRNDFIQRGPSCTMKPAARKKFIQTYEKRLDTLVNHPIFGYQVSYRRVLEIQVRLVSRLLYGEISEYPGFRTR